MIVFEKKNFCLKDSNSRFEINDFSVDLFFCNKMVLFYKKLPILEKNTILSPSFTINANFCHLLLLVILKIFYFL